MKFEIFSPATIGNVSSGFDILGLAVDELGDRFHIKAQRAYSIEAVGRDASLVPRDPYRNTVTLAAEEFYKLLGVAPQPFSLHLDRSLPLSGGLGSSAASSVAGALAAAKLVDAMDQRDLIMKAALHSESIVSGRHLDNVAPCLLGGLVLIQNIDRLQVYQVPINLDLWITIVTPQVKVRTKEARKVLPPQLSTSLWTQQMAHCTTLALAFAQGDAEQLIFGLIDTFAEPRRSTFIPHFEHAKERALQAGSYGLSISGSGPSCFALSATQSIAHEVAEVVKSVMGPQTETYVLRPRLQGAEVLL